MQRARGFTLVEILVVVVIIVIVIAGAMLSLSFLGPDRALDSEGQRLAALMNYAEEQASLQTREFGLYCTTHGYFFLTFNAITNQWQPVTQDEALRARALPDGLTLQLNVDGQDVQLKEQPPAASSAPAAGAQGSSTPSSAPASVPTPYALPQGAADSSAAAIQQLQPQVMIFSNGDLSNFRLTLGRDGGTRTVQLKADAQGRVFGSEPAAGT